ncbi:MAG TPA: hypothetical protein VFO35_20310 [Steroidobacteraceae bacterium]|nr:hypothetical protein [Steroidobacteraceae bacterium]
MNDRAALCTDADLWAMEREFWLGGADVYEARVAPEALLVLPDPAGTLMRSQTIEAIRQSPRWEEVEFESAHTVWPTADLVLLAYAAVGRRDRGRTTYRARCSSMYVEKGGLWMLIFHQQTPRASHSNV